MSGLENQIRVLFVDDDLGFLKQAKKFLERERKRLVIETATSVERGMREFMGGGFDAVVSDYQMPEINGIEFLKDFRDEGYEVPFIILTGKGREEVAMEAMNLGASHYLQKGGEPVSLFEALADALVQEVEHWRARKKIEKVRERYMRIFESFGDGVVIVKNGGNNHGEIFECNPTFSEQTGYSEDELIGKNIRDLVIEVVTNGEGTKMDAYEEELLEGESLFYTEKKQKKDGTTYWVEVVATPISYDDKKAALAINRDITERKEREEELEKAYKAIDTSQDAFIGINEDGGIFFCNKATSEIFGYTERELKGKAVTELMPEEYRDSHKRGLKRFLTGRSGSERFLEVEGLRKNGSKFPLEWSLSHFEREDGTVEIFAVGRDITERKHRRAEQLRKELVMSTSENIAGDIIREFRVDISAEEMGLPELLEHLAVLSTNPPPENTFGLMVTGIKRSLLKSEIEASKEEIRRILVPIIQKFTREIFSLAGEYYIDIPSEYTEFKKELDRELEESEKELHSS